VGLGTGGLAPPFGRGAADALGGSDLGAADDIAWTHEREREREQGCGGRFEEMTALRQRFGAQINGGIDKLKNTGDDVTPRSIIAIIPSARV
jgi:hypothetical protein